MTLDTVSQLLTHLRNAAMSRQSEAMVPLTRFNERILAVLKSNDLIGSYAIEDDTRNIVVSLLPGASLPLQQVSKPGARRYAAYAALRKIGRGELLIVSTSQGVMTAHEALQRKLGGEVVVRVKKDL